ncbi:helix-turn-helix transcriptional regulator [Mesorhizobium sp. SP-1A]|uniref:helix-turn-helix transcriptional regulator n=1 Tax=Mesorhizobium sp. SP-1A TaxID=3077840 RepID=UPI0028F6DAC7|nr:helix-turn-helix transcriptional regulator [Mesorhizobium sp. SP-1A]
MRHAGNLKAAQAFPIESDAAAEDPFGAGLQLTGIQDAARRCRRIAMDIGAETFGLYFLGPSPERARLVPCFDSDCPGLGGVTRMLSGANAEEVARHARISTQPCFWADEEGLAAAFDDLTWARRVAPLAPATSGIAFPVLADRNQCGLMIFFSPKAVLTDDLLCDVHARCFSLFGAVVRIRPGDDQRMRAISKRELECLKLTANGYTSEEIARQLRLSVHTANQYLTQTAQKLNAVSRTQAVAKALRLGLIE